MHAWSLAAETGTLPYRLFWIPSKGCSQNNFISFPHLRKVQCICLRPSLVLHSRPEIQPKNQAAKYNDYPSSSMVLVLSYIYYPKGGAAKVNWWEAKISIAFAVELRRKTVFFKRLYHIYIFLRKRGKYPASAETTFSWWRIHLFNSMKDYVAAAACS